MISTPKIVNQAANPLCSGKAVTVQKAAVASAFPEATHAAMEILAAGGNAIDAAVAAAWALSVCEPAGSGLGGQTSLLLQLSQGEIVYLDGHSQAPAGVSLKSVRRRQQQFGFRSCTIPSTPVTLAKAQARYGTLSLDTVLQPAIRLAHDGFKITELQRRQVGWGLNNLKLECGKTRLLSRRRWLKAPSGIFKQPRLAKTLERIALYGCKDFYQGELAEQIALDMKAHGGLITKTDLNSFKLPVQRRPISIQYRGFEVLTTPPPGGGLQLLLALKLLDRLLDRSQKISDAEWYESVALAVYAAFVEREKFPIHPDDFTYSIREWALSDNRSDELALQLKLQQSVKAMEKGDEEVGETTHLCVADEQGNVAALTQSIQSLFGALVVNRPLGFLYNNYLSTCPRYRHPYQLASKCLPRSNAAPTFLLKDGQVVLALGAAGSRRIISSILQIISQIVDHGKSVAEAITAPRVHAPLNGKVWIEKPAATAANIQNLKSHFSKVVIRSKHSFAMAGAQALAIGQDADQIKTAAADPRRDGMAGGF